MDSEKSLLYTEWDTNPWNKPQILYLVYYLEQWIPARFQYWDTNWAKHPLTLIAGRSRQADSEVTKKSKERCFNIVLFVLYN